MLPWVSKEGVQTINCRDLPLKLGLACALLVLSTQDMAGELVSRDIFVTACSK